MNFKKAFDSVTRKVLYNILIEFGIPEKILKLMKICLNETYTRIRLGKHLCNIISYYEWFETRKGFISIAFIICFRVHHLESSGKKGWLEIKWHKNVFGLSDDVNISGGSVYAIKENREALLVLIREIALEENVDKTK